MKIALGLLSLFIASCFAAAEKRSNYRRHYRPRSLYSSSASERHSHRHRHHHGRHRHRRQYHSSDSFRIDPVTDLSQSTFTWSASSSGSTTEEAAPALSPIPVIVPTPAVENNNNPDNVVVEIVQDAPIVLEVGIDADITPFVAQNEEFKRAFVLEMAHQKRSRGFFRDQSSQVTFAQEDQE